MEFNEKLNNLTEKSKLNNNQIKVSEIEGLFSPSSDEYFKVIDILSDLNISIIPDNLEENINEIDEDIYRTDDKSITNIYLRDIGTVKLISKEEEVELA